MTKGSIVADNLSIARIVSSPLDWHVHIRNILQDKVDQLLPLFFAQKLYEGLRFELLTKFVRR
jgi:hypothetical protein